MARRDYSTTRRNTGKTTLQKVAQAFGLDPGLNRNQIKSELATMSQKVVRQGLKRALLVGTGVGGLAGSLLPQSLKTSLKDDLISPPKTGTGNKGRNKARTPVNRALDSAKKAVASPPKKKATKPKPKPKKPIPRVRPKRRPGS